MQFKKGFVAFITGNPMMILECVPSLVKYKVHRSMATIEKGWKFT